MFVVLSLLYGKLVIVACIAFVVSKEITKSLPVQYYEVSVPDFSCNFIRNEVRLQSITYRVLDETTSEKNWLLEDITCLCVIIVA